MRNIVTSLGVWLLCFCSLPALHAQNVRVMQGNVERGLGRLSNNTNAQAKAIARIVNYNQPDVLLFNEVDCSNGLSVAQNEAAIIDWVTNNVPYLGTQVGVTFYVEASTSSDSFIRNAAVSRYPIFAEGTYTSANMIRGLHALRVQLEGTNVLQVFHAHFKCCDDGSDPGSCGQRQTNAVFASNTIRAWAATNSLPYIFAGDWNEDEANPQCSLFSGYRPITMVRTNGNLVEFKPTALNGDSDTIGTPAPTRRFDYCLAGSNRLSAVSGFVFNSTVWAQNGLYTNASPQNLSTDSTTASDHCSVFVNYSFPTSVTNFTVIPTNAFTTSGNQGGSFSPSSQIYALTNTDTIPLFWSVTKTSDWLTVSTLATNLTLGAGRGTNITASINSAANLLCPGTYTDTINFSNTATGISLSRDVSLTVTGLPPTASFTGSPTNGIEPVTVTFTDTSTGLITNRFWNFGDGGTTNITTNIVSRTYTGGNYTVTLVVSGPCGVSTNTQPNYLSVLPVSTISVLAGDLQDRFGNLMPTSGVAVLVVDTGTNGFVDPQPTFPMNPGANWGVDDQIVGLWNLTDSYNNYWGQPGGLADQTVVVYTGGVAAGQKLQLYWFPSLTLSSNTVGVTYYGKYTDTNSPPLDGSGPWSLPAAGSTNELYFFTQSEFGSNPDAAGQATNLTAELTAFQSWQIQYFGSTNGANALPNADPDGDGTININEFLSGFNPTDSTAYLHIINVAASGIDGKVTYLGANGDSNLGIASRTNVLEYTTGTGNGSYTNNFASTGVSQILSNGIGIGVVTNMVDVGGATNNPARYYRIRIVP